MKLIIDYLIHQLHANQWTGAYEERSSSFTYKKGDDSDDSDDDGNAHGRISLPDDAKRFKDVRVQQLLETMPAEERSTWCILYCGNSAPVRKILGEQSKRWKFLYSEESFAW